METKLKRKITGLVFALVMVITIFPPAPAGVSAATTWTVDDNGSADFSTIQGAIDAASDGDTISVAAGTYYEHVIIDKDLTLIGEDPETTIIDGGGTGQVIIANGSWSSPGPSFTLEGFTITNGFASGSSSHQLCAGISCFYSGPGVIRNCRIIGNYSNWPPYPNPIGYGGGIYLYNLGRHGVTDFRIENCLIANNYAGSKGGGIACYTESSPSIINCTIVDNSAWYDVEDDVWVFHDSDPIIRNSIIGKLTIVASSPTPGNITYNDILSGPYIEGNISADPLFTDPEAGDYHLQPSSPCIDVGDNITVPSWLTTDFEGDPRILDGNGDGDKVVDMGADECYIVAATIGFDPATVNLKSKGKWITCYIELPEGYNVGDIDVDSILLNGEVEAEPRPLEIGNYDGDSVADLMVKFEQSAVQDTLEVGDEVGVMVTGEVEGTLFGGTDIIRVIDKG